MGRFRITEDCFPYFLTSRIVRWLPVFTAADTCGIIVQSLKHCREHKGLLIHGFVIMPSHLHLIVSGPDLRGILRNFKRHTAAELVRHFEQAADPPFINVFRYCGSNNQPPTAHMVWWHDNHPEQISTEPFLRQKLDYCHANPVRKGLVDDPVHWVYSSARHYLLDEPGVLPVDAIEL